MSGQFLSYRHWENIAFCAVLVLVPLGALLFARWQESRHVPASAAVADAPPDRFDPGTNARRLAAYHEAVIRHEAQQHGCESSAIVRQDGAVWFLHFDDGKAPLARAGGPVTFRQRAIDLLTEARHARAATGGRAFPLPALLGCDSIAENQEQRDQRSAERD